MNKAAKIVLGIFLTFLILMLSGALGAELTSIIDFFPLGFFNQSIILLFSSILIYIFNKRGIIDFNIGKINLKEIILPILLSILLVIITDLIYQRLFGTFNENQGNLPILTKGEQFITILILGSLSEELLFRGFLQNMLNPLKSLGIKLLNLKLSFPVIISGILFGVMHFAILSIGASFQFTMKIVISSMILGMIAGYFQEKHQNFLFALIVHMTANLTGMILAMII